MFISILRHESFAKIWEKQKQRFQNFKEHSQSKRQPTFMNIFVLPRYRKFVYLGSLVEKLEDGFSNSMKEIFLNGRFSEGALAR